MRAMGKRYGADEIDCEDIAESCAIGICLHPEIDDWDTAKRWFFKTVKFRMAMFKERSEVGESLLTQMAAGRRTATKDPLGTGVNIFDILPLGHIAASQEKRCYLIQVLREIDQLPTQVQRTMRLLMLGNTPLDIAAQWKRDVGDVLRDIRIARDWIESANELPAL